MKQTTEEREGRIDNIIPDNIIPDKFSLCPPEKYPHKDITEKIIS
jgi:hypothetical protein